MSDTVLQELHEGVLVLTLNRPQKKNAFNAEQWQALADALEAARTNEDVNVVVITGAGGNFSAGQDLSDSRSLPGGGGASYQTGEAAVTAFDKPLIGAATGVAVGGGATILFYCDVLFVGESLRLRVPFTSLGMAPEFASTYMLQARVGTQRAADILLSSAWIDAAEAVDAGIARAQCPDDQLLTAARNKAVEIAQWPVNALKETKRCLKVMHETGIQAALRAEHEAMERQAGSPENTEAVMAFLEKRPPDFKKLKKK
ncbi:MAG: enoyl-CoA hydratase-related protein [Desulfosudaceae bacterium]